MQTETLLRSVDLASPWLLMLAGTLSGAESPGDADAAVDVWAEEISRDAAMASLLYESGLRAWMAAQLMVRSVELAGEVSASRGLVVARRDDDGVSFLSLPFEEAIQFFRDKAVITPEEFRELQDRFRTGGFTAVRLASETLRARAKAAIQRALEGGSTIAETVRDIRNDAALLGIEPETHGYLATVVRTNVASAHGAGRFAAMSSPDVIRMRPYRQYLSAGDTKVRDAHRALHGKVFRADDEASEHYFPPLGFNCFPGDVEVQGTFNVGLRGWYDGEIVKIATQHGRCLAVTPNHPVATVNGFVPAGTIREGDQVLRYEGPIEATPTATPQRAAVDEQKAPARIEDVFATLAESGERLAAEVRPDDLHGEAERIHGHIDVVGAERTLSDGHVSGAGQYRRDLVLVRPDALGVGDEAGQASLGLGRGRVDSPGRGHPRSTELALHSGAVEFQLRPLQDLRVGPAANLHITRYQDAADDAARDAAFVGKMLLGGPGDVLGDDRVVVHVVPWRAHLDSPALQDSEDGGRAAAESLGDLPGGVAGYVTADHVVSIERARFVGHVYDLQSPLGWIVAEGIVTSNCRCTMVTRSEREIERRGLSVTEGRIDGVEPDRGWAGRPQPLE